MPGGTGESAGTSYEVVEDDSLPDRHLQDSPSARRSSRARSSSSAPVSHSMMRSPIRAMRSGSVIPSSSQLPQNGTVILTLQNVV